MFLISLLYNISEEVLELVEFSAADYICGRLARTRQKGNVSADA
jgi:hypothetical protein